MLLTFSNIHKYQQLSNCKTQTEFIKFSLSSLAGRCWTPPSSSSPSGETSSSSLKQNQHVADSCVNLQHLQLKTSSYSHLWRHCVWWTLTGGCFYLTGGRRQSKAISWLLRTQRATFDLKTPLGSSRHSFCNITTIFKNQTLISC